MLTVGTVVVAPASKATAAGDQVSWGRQYFDLRNSSFNPYETTISPANVADLQVAWVAPLDSHISALAGPLVVGSTVYIGTLDALIAFDARSGRQLWTFPLGTDAFAGGIATWHNLVYVTDDFPHTIYAVDADTGQEVWHLDETGGTDGPVVIDDRLFFTVNSGQLHAVHPDTGEPFWTTQLAGDSSAFVAAAHNTLYVGASDGLHAVDPHTGAIEWSMTGIGEIEGSVALGGDKLS